MNLALTLLASLVPTSLASAAQEVPRYGLPERVELQGMASLGGGGQMTPDGRVILRGWAYNGQWSAPIDGWPVNNWPGTNVLLPGWAVQVIRPENITRDPDYSPDFTDAFSPSGDGYLVEPGCDVGFNEYTDPFFPLEPHVDHPSSYYDPRSALPPERSGSEYPRAVASGVPEKTHATWFPDPVLDTTPSGLTPPSNPYACDGNGVPLDSLSVPEHAAYVAYEMISITHSSHFEIRPNGSNGTYWQYRPDRSRVWQTPMKVVVVNPYTPTATIHKAWVTGAGQELRWSNPNRNPSTGTMFLSEVSVTQNGHFLIGHGAKPAAYTNGNNLFPSRFAFEGMIWATWNGTPQNPATWSEPVLLSEVYDYRNVTLKQVNGTPIPLGDVVRIAQSPLRYQDGEEIDELVVNGSGQWITAWDATIGAYPWVHWDGDGVMYPLVGARGTVAYCGVQTNWTFATLDAANLSHLSVLPDEQPNLTDEEHIMSGLMAMTGMWDVYRGTQGRAILEAHPAHPRHPVFAFVHGAHKPHQMLTTMSFEDWSDGEYMVFLRMTPLVKKIHRAASSLYVPARHELGFTADTSGNYHVARLLPDASPMNNTVPDTGAAFTVGTSDVRPTYSPPLFLPFHRPRFDIGGTTAGKVKGKIGEGVRLGREGYVLIESSTPSSSSLDSASLSIEAFVKPTDAFLGLTRTQNTQLFHHPERITVWITPDGSLQTDLPDPASGSVESYLTDQPVLTDDEWVHVAITFGDGELRCYADGGDAGTDSTSVSSLPTSPVNAFEIGPHGTVTGSDEILLYVDEFRLSRIARSAEEVARHAFVETDRVWETNPTNLPPVWGTSLEPEDCRVNPSRPWTAEKSEFGDYLFSNVNLSLNQNYSCAACHEPSQSFTDGLPRAVGQAGAQLPFNTPTLLNAVAGVEMFWDMRARDLHEQVIQPIITPAELGFSSIQPVLDRLNEGDAQALLLCEQAFGPGLITEDKLAQGLESYVQAQLASMTAVDWYEQGSAGALTYEEKRGRALFRGKARCISCHSGPNYTNSLAQNTGAATTGQPGRSVQTGRQRDLGAFKTPTLRRSSDALTSGSTKPYFHDGFVDTLDEVVDFYDLGGGQAGVDAIVPPPGRAAIGTTHVDMLRLALTPAEKQDLLAFLRRLGE